MSLLPRATLHSDSEQGILVERAAKAGKAAKAVKAVSLVKVVSLASAMSTAKELLGEEFQREMALPVMKLLVARQCQR